MRHGGPGLLCAASIVRTLLNKYANGGSLFDLPRTDPKAIARIAIENVGLARTRKIRKCAHAGYRCGRAEGPREVEASRLTAKCEGWNPETDMPTPERMRAVRRVIGLVEALIATLDEVADELAEAEDEVADAAMINNVSDRLASAKHSVATALAMLPQWAKDAEADDDGEAGDA
jgi:hypothetical protein